VVFVTAYSKYAVQAFRFSAVDYLLKPVKVRELKEAIVKVKKESVDFTYQNISALLENLKAPSETKKSLVINDSKGFTIVKTSDIIMCMADGFCTHFSLTGNQKITSSKILKHYEEILCEEQFMRVHHSYIVNIEHVKGYVNQGMILLSEDLSCPLSALHKSAFLNKLKGLK
jgi:two-component system LytT family response regulator